MKTRNINVVDLNSIIEVMGVYRCARLVVALTKEFNFSPNHTTLVDIISFNAIVRNTLGSLPEELLFLEEKVQKDVQEFQNQKQKDIDLFPMLYVNISY